MFFSCSFFSKKSGAEMVYETQKMIDYGTQMLLVLKEVCETSIIDDLSQVSKTMQHVHIIFNNLTVMADDEVHVHNYFCYHINVTDDSASSCILVLYDHPELRKVADDCNVSEFVYFGLNSDPITKCTGIEFVQRMFCEKLKLRSVAS